MKKGVLSLAFIPLLLLSSCGEVDTNSDVCSITELTSSSPREMYDNSYGKDRIPDYWDSYGCGDPFVYRYDGMYYLIVSTKSMETGVMGWKSKDMLTWEKVQAEGLPDGYVSVDESTFTAYAPEVIYKDGWFYMCESRRGQGHYILRSRSPEGPFVKYIDNFGERIDGSFFLDDDETLYFLRANNDGIRINKMDDDLNIIGKVNLENTMIGGWTEGPGLIKKDGFYYLTFTGTAVTSPGYRVAYSYFDSNVTDKAMFRRGAFQYGSCILLNTSSEYNGLGHSASVLGPNMDSYYMVYHDLISLNGPYRRFNMARMLFNGSELGVNHPEKKDNLVPQMPDFSSYNKEGFDLENGFVLSNKSTSSYFTVEFNTRGEGKKMVLSYSSPTDYAYVINNSNKISLHQVSNGNDKVLASSTLNKQYDYGYLHSYRIQYKDSRFALYFDSMKKIDVTLDVALKEGKIGYEEGNDYSFTAFTNDAFDSSEKRDWKQDKFYASEYDEEKSTFKSSLVRIEKSEAGNGVDGSKAVRLNKGERTSYRVYLNEDSNYGIDLTIPYTSMGKYIGIRLDNGKTYKCKIPSYSSLDDVIKVNIGQIEGSKGTHYLTFYGLEDGVEFINGEFYKTTNNKLTFENDLKSFVTHGVNYVNMWKIKYDGHYALSGNRQLLYIGDSTMRDYEVEVDMTLDGETQATSAGILLRGSNAAFASSDSDDSIQGFYCGLGNSSASIKECNYGDTLSGPSDAGINLFPSGEKIHLKAVAKGNNISLYINGELSLTYLSLTGPTHGPAALYTCGAAAVYQNLKVTIL